MCQIKDKINRSDPKISDGAGNLILVVHFPILFIWGVTVQFWCLLTAKLKLRPWRLYYVLLHAPHKSHCQPTQKFLGGLYLDLCKGAIHTCTYIFTAQNMSTTSGCHLTYPLQQHAPDCFYVLSSRSHLLQPQHKVWGRD